MISKSQPSTQNAQREKKKSEWAKIYAYSVDKEAGVDWKEKRETMISRLRKEPDSPSMFPEKVWVPSHSLLHELMLLALSSSSSGRRMDLPSQSPSGRSWKL